MTRRRKFWILAAAIGLGTAIPVGVAVVIGGRRMAREFEPYVKQQAIDYLRRRFDSEVEIATLNVNVPRLSPTKLYFSKGKGVMAGVEATGILLRHKGRRDLPPMFTMKAFRFEVDLGHVYEGTKRISLVKLDGMEIHVPPKGERPKLAKPAGAEAGPLSGAEKQARAAAEGVIIDDIEIRDARLVILPKRKDRKPLEFLLHEIHFKSAGIGRPLNYTARLTNPKPPGRVVSTGSFGPWNAETPGESALNGEYVFSNADLGVFRAIAGTLQSKGSFTGTLDDIHAKGEATVPDFRLRRSGQRVPLRTNFEVVVDGTNGNTELKPVHATLGASTRFTTSGAIIKHDGDPRRTVRLMVNMPHGDLGEVMRLAAAGPPLMSGKLLLNTVIVIPPLSGKVVDKLYLKGTFEIRDGKFLKQNIQDKLDSFSRRGQGQPRNEAIDEVVSGMRGNFVLDDQMLSFAPIGFALPGAAVELSGNYKMDADQLDFHGTLRLDAKVSQTQTGWKRIALKPVDPFFSKNGAGTFLKIQVTGTAKDPAFGRDKAKR